MKIYAILDNKSNTWATPFFQPTQVHAVRAFKTEVNRAADNNMFYMYPNEYDLYCIGNYDEATGLLTGLEKNELICNGSAVKVKE